MTVEFTGRPGRGMGSRDIASIKKMDAAADGDVPDGAAGIPY